MVGLTSHYPGTGSIVRGGLETPASSLSEHQALRELARRYRIQTAYYDVHKQRCEVSPDTLLAALRCLGAPVEDTRDVSDALREHKRSVLHRAMAPVIVAWDGKWPVIQLTLPARLAPSPLKLEIDYEDGRHIESDLNTGDLPDFEAREVEGGRFIVKAFSLTGECPFGYHRMRVETAGKRNQSLIISAPARTYWPQPSLRTWGFFLPLYALHSERSWGAGDFNDMDRLMDWIVSQGGDVLATLPLLPQFLEAPCNPSPYSPVSRLLWNEFYIDVTASPELPLSPEARKLMESGSFNQEIKSLKESKYIDYPRQMRLKRKVLEHLCRSLYSQGSQRLGALERFADEHPHALDYARFRATMEKRGASWQNWPEYLHHGNVSASEYEEETARYYLYTQWLSSEHMSHLAGKAREGGTGLYLDFPLGAHAQGYDAWRYREALVVDASVGAPPDAVFTRGQDWGMPPAHPDKSRERFYEYYIACIRHHLQYAGILRLDHVMGLHRVFIIPHGMAADQGTYIGFRSEELYAILTLESHRNQCIIIGEDLGTVPPYVRPAMHQHGLGRMYVLQYELDSRPEGGIGRINDEMVASTSTHDMPTFKSYWEAGDLDLRVETGLLDRASDKKEAEIRRKVRERIVSFLKKRNYLDDDPDSVNDVFVGLASFFAQSRAPLVLIDLEDVWGETEPQNLPGTVDRPNWERKTRYTLEEIENLPEVGGIVNTLNHWRGGKRKR